MAAVHQRFAGRKSQAERQGTDSRIESSQTMLDAGSSRGSAQSLSSCQGVIVMVKPIMPVPANIKYQRKLTMVPDLLPLSEPARRRRGSRQKTTQPFRSHWQHFGHANSRVVTRVLTRQRD